LVIGRNSRFFTEELDDEELQELGGVEYRALRLLSRLVPVVSRHPMGYGSPDVMPRVLPELCVA
jgi:hypothetical protein